MAARSRFADCYDGVGSAGVEVQVIRAVVTTVVLLLGLGVFCAMRTGVTPAGASARPIAVGDETSRTSTISFNRDIRPIISRNCLQCHGPDGGARKAGLRLDEQATATAELPSGRRAIVPGDSRASELIRRVTSTDPEVHMPPPEMHARLTREEIDLFRAWIDDGAEWQRHWAFIPPTRPVLPRVRDADWPRNGIDRFVLSRLDAEGLVPSPAAEGSMLLRRVTLDLTGLPPTLDEIDAFLRDDDPDAYERVVDRLLASPRFGERMAIPWLDSARYADSYGYQSDQLSPTWPYRDWVVRAFNANLPYDEFITQQIAGDLIPDAQREQRLATAFNRLHRMTNEGGSIEAEFRTEYAADRAQTYATSMLGLSMECARCHDHKFDPISTREYYSLFAFFNSIDEWGMYHDSSRVPTPSLLLPTAAQERVISERTEALRAADDRVTEITSQRDDAFRAWLALAPDLSPNMPGLVGHYPLDAIRPENRFENLANADNPGSTSPANTLVEGRHGRALRFTGDDAASFPNVAAGLNPWDAYSVAFWLRIPENLDDCVIFHRSGGTDVGRFGAELSLKSGRLFFGVIRFWPGNALAIETTKFVETGQWIHIGVTHDASGRAAGMRLYLDGKPAATRELKDRLTKSPGAGGNGITFGERFRDAGMMGGDLDELVVFNRALAPVEIAHLFDRESLREALAAGDETALREYYFSSIDADVASARTVRAAALLELFRVRDRVAETMVMEELTTPRDAHVLARGEYDAPRTDDNRVPRDTPALLPPFPKDVPRNRLGLAQWTTGPTNPLTARVAVNRFWQAIFGRGLVETSENLGTQGSLPSHPELLDWLAIEFVESGWDVKRLLKKIVTSATYRQASALRDDLIERDPGNELLARGPSHRLTAEMLRDVALAASGLLDETMGGPPVSPYQPGGYWREANTMSPAYKQSVGGALHRRSLYTVWKRTAPMPNMIAFDAATREACIVRRQSTNSPTQALVLLNDPQFVEAARIMGERMMNEGGDTPAARIEFAVRVFTGRRPTHREAQLLLELHADQREHFAADPAMARILLTPAPGSDEDPSGSETPRAANAPADTDSNTNASANEDLIDTAAAMIVAQTILNMDATVWKR